MNIFKKISASIKYRRYSVIRSQLIKYFRHSMKNQKFCIISNDCWGAELYKLLDRRFNTPFIGLMLMGPCYIKLLGNLKYNISLPLNFKEQSKYTEMQAIKSGVDFPLAELGNSGIEVHFLHYKSRAEAEEKWQRRVTRIDWEHLFIKYDCSKDYANKETVGKFIKMPYTNKLVFGKESFGFKEVVLVQHCPYNAVKQFRTCFMNFSPVGWLKGETIYKSWSKKYIGRLASKYL